MVFLLFSFQMQLKRATVMISRKLSNNFYIVKDIKLDLISQVLAMCLERNISNSFSRITLKNCQFLLLDLTSQRPQQLKLSTSSRVVTPSLFSISTLMNQTLATVPGATILKSLGRPPLQEPLPSKWAGEGCGQGRVWRRAADRQCTGYFPGLLYPVTSAEQHSH